MSEKNRVLKDVKFWTPLRMASTLIVLAMLVSFSASSCNSNDPAPKAQPASSTGSGRARVGAAVNVLPQVVMDAENRGTRGAAIRLSDYSGKVLLVNLWATWCTPCRVETPELVKLHKEFQSRGVEVIGLSTENPDASAQMVDDFVRAYKVDYAIGWATPELRQTLMQGNTSIPQSFIIARDGQVLKRFIGFNPQTTPSQLKKALEEALVLKG